MEKKSYKLNKVEGFDPYDHVESAIDRHGEIIKKKDGTELKYLSTAAKVTWFRMVYPKGSLRTVLVNVDNIDMGVGIIARAKAEVRLDAGDEYPVAEWSHQETIWDVADLDTTISKIQTIALGKALSRAGFGCEIEMTLDLGFEGETPDETTVPEVKKKPKKKEQKASAQTTEDAENAEAEIADLMSMIDAETTEEASEEAIEEAAEDLTEKYLKLELRCTDKAPMNIRKLEGMTLEEIIASHPSFCTLVATKKNIQSAVTPDVVEAATHLAK